MHEAPSFSLLASLFADLPEQQDAFLSPSFADFEEQHDAWDLLQELLSLLPDFASFALADFAAPRDVAFSFNAAPPRATFFMEPSEVLVLAISEEEDLLDVEASDWALAAKAKNANTLRIRTFFIEVMICDTGQYYSVSEDKHFSCFGKPLS